MRAFCRAVLAVAVFGVGAPAAAQPAPDPEARAGELYTQGIADYKLAEYDRAITAFKEAYRLVPDPSFLFNLAQAYRLKQDCRQAAWFYKKYLTDAPDGEQADLAKGFLTQMEACAVTQPSTPATDPVGVTVPPPVEPPPPTTPVVPAPVPARLDETPLPLPPAPAPRRSHTLRWVGLGVASVGAVSAGASLYFGGRASGAQSDLDACTIALDCDGAGTTAAELDERGTSAERNQLITGISGGVLLAGGLALFLLDPGGSASEAPPIAVVPVANGGLVTWRGAL